MKKLLIIMTVILTITSCKKLTDLNADKKQPTDVPSQTLFANATKNLVDQITTPNNNFNVLRLFSQYWSAVTYTDETNYDLTTRAITLNEFTVLYRDVLSDLKEAKRVVATESSIISTDAEKKNKSAITEILTIYTFQRLVDIFGNVPYSEALDIENILPVYDDGQTIYSKLFTRLDAAIADLDENAGGFGSSDLIYNGDTKKWKLFANSLKIKLAITVADVPALDPGSKINNALNAGIFNSTADDANFAYLGVSPNTNPVWVNLVSSGRLDWVPSNTLIDKMNALKDPRRSSYFTDNIKDGANNVIYVGGTYGTKNSYDACSHLTLTIQKETRQAALLQFTEIQFYLAEAAARGLIGGSAETYYNKAIESSILFWGGSASDVTSYLSNPDVAYSTAAGTDKEKIATQAWIAYFDRGEIGWTTWRRLDAPKFNPPPKMTNADIPTRYTYPVAEQTLNLNNYTSAAAAIGGDTKTTKLFWDKY